jgi:single-stranded-DNA-specific exonuclease
LDWLEPPDLTIPAGLRKAVGGHPLVTEILARRGITDVETARAFLDPAHYTPSPPTDIPDLALTAELLIDSIRRGQRILVWGDFDVDGQTSTALLYDALCNLGARVSYHVPHRLKHGHGVQVDVLMNLLREDGIRVILTCDTGVDAHEAVDAAKVNGLTMLITDHHALPDTLPDAPVVNPQRLPQGHPLRDLPGVGVAYMLVQRLYALAGRKGEEQQFLDLVALGIVSDVATQRLDTRYLLQLGIESLRNPQRVGLQALMTAAQVDPENLSTDTIGFQVGPRLNALGRLADASLAVELLTTHDVATAQQIANQLEGLNDRRKQIENQIYAAALDAVTADSSLLGFEGLVLAGPNWHTGVIGIVASRLVEQYGKPTVMLALDNGKAARGSARSVPGVDIGACIAAQSDLLIRHGGHPGAAGLSLDPALIPQFRRRLSNTISETRDPNVRPGRQIDAELALGDLSMELAEELNRLAPFGQGNPPIHLLTRGVKQVSCQEFGVNNRHRRVFVEDEAGTSYPVTWWRGSEHATPPSAFDLLYIPRINDYKGRHSLQLEWVDHRLTPGSEAEGAGGIEVVDLRGEADPLGALDGADVVVWAEALSTHEELPFDPAQVGTRFDIGRGDDLLIWTAPPGPDELTQVLDRTGAQRVYIAARHEPNNGLEAFLRRLGGLVNYALREYGGEVEILRLAGATAQREFTMRQGLAWMAAKGEIRLEWLDGGRVRLVRGGSPDHETLGPIWDDLQALIAEAAAFRAYFRSSADLTRFFGG